MNKKFDEGFKKLDEAFTLVGEGIDEFFKKSPEAKVTATPKNTFHIRLVTLEDRFKAAFRLITKGEITIKKKEK